MASEIVLIEPKECLQKEKLLCRENLENIFKSGGNKIVLCAAHFILKGCAKSGMIKIKAMIKTKTKLTD